MENVDISISDDFYFSHGNPRSLFFSESQLVGSVGDDTAPR